MGKPNYLQTSNGCCRNGQADVSRWCCGRRWSWLWGLSETRTRGRALNSNVFLLPSVTDKIAAKEFPGWTILDHEDKPERTWTTDELGSLTANSGHSIARLRLARIADRTATGWQITQQSVGRARLSGMTADQILGWLGGHLTAEVPALLEVAVRNWTGRQGVKLSQVQLLRITATAGQGGPASECDFPAIPGRAHPAGMVLDSR